MNNSLWTISNMLSLSRIILMIPASYFLYTPGHFHREVAVLIILMAVATDAMDGYVARKLNQVSEMGKIIDPLADKIGVGIVVVMLMIFGDIPLWYAILVLGRDAMIFFAGMLLKQKKGIVLPSIMAGKVAVSFVALTLIFAMLRYPFFVQLLPYSLSVSVIMLLYSFLLYTIRFFQTIR